MIMTKSGPYQQTREEMEVVITFNAKGSTMMVHSTYPKINRKLDKLCEEYPGAYKRVPDPCGVEDDFRKYEIDKKLLTFRRPVSQARAEAARQIMARNTGTDGEKDT